MIYTAIFLTLLFLALFEFYAYERNIVFRPRVPVSILICIVLIILAGGRLNTGFDYDGYEQYFVMIKDGSLQIINSIVEPLYVILNIIMPSYRALLFFMSTACVLTKYIAFKKLDVRLLVFVFLIYFATFFLTYDMGVIRQGLSMGIGLLSIPLIEKKDKRFFIVIVLATLIHISAITFVPLYFLRDKEFSRVTYYSFMGVAALIAFLASSDVLQSSFFLNAIEAVGGKYIAYKVKIYLSATTGNYLMTVAKRIIIGGIFIEWFKKKQRLERKKEGLVWTLINGYVLSIPLFSILLMVGLVQMAGRIATPLYMLYCIIYEKVLRTKHYRWVRIVLLLLFVVLSYSTLRETVYTSSGDSYRNYQFFLP